jgi:peptidyl-dipeptidase Dcp
LLRNKTPFMNPFFETYTTPFETPPFHLIKLEHYLPALERGIQEAQKEIEMLIALEESPTFENTIAALEKSGELLDKVTSVFFNLNSAETNSEMQALAQEISPKLVEHKNNVLMDAELFKRIEHVYQHENRDRLTEEQKTLLDKTYKSFARNGARLGKKDQEKLRKIDAQLSKASLKFGEHVLEESNSYELVIENEQDLQGLPGGAVEAAKQLAQERGKPQAWIFTLDYPSYIPFITYCENRSLRQQIHHAFGSKAFQKNPQNNEALILEMVKLRAERAELLGYETHAQFVLEERMAEDPQKVEDFLTDLQNKAMLAAQSEFERLEKYAQDMDGIDVLQKWDASFYSEKLKKELHALDDEALRPYFKLENVVQGVFDTAEKLFGIQFKKMDDVPVYHKDVEAYEVLDKTGKHLAVFYADFFPRPGKRQGAWMTSFRSQRKDGNKDIRPHVSIVCNFTAPTSTKPSLLTFREVTTLFHEFGHALHGMLADGTYAGLSGTSVYWDFVELPSQILENWCYEEECLNLFAEHYETGEILPKEYIDRIKAAAQFNTGLATIRQISLAILDMKWHTLDTKSTDAVQDVGAFERQATEQLSLYPEVPGTCTSAQFSHIFQGGYSSGYYSYKWAEVLDADAFEYFQEKGIFNQEVAERFRKYILSAGGSEHPSVLYKKFRGRNPSNDALLKRAGLLK